MVERMKNKYAELLRTWCDTMEAHLVRGMGDPNLDGGILCPACHRIHGRCADAMPAYLYLANETGEAHYRETAEALFDWSERNMKREDGSLYNDSNSFWRGTTVFSLGSLELALDECEKGSPLYEKIKASVIEKADFVASDTFFGFHPNVNYFACAPEALYRAFLITGNEKYSEKAEWYFDYVTREFVTEDGMLWGEGHPLRAENGTVPFDMGYNLEESLSGLAAYADLTGDAEKKRIAARLMRRGLDFMLPDGGIDNSWGARSNKWTYYGSRTSDGMMPGLIHLSDVDPIFPEAAERNFEAMKKCTADGLLSGGLMYGASNEPICVHHSFTHCKSLVAMAKHFTYKKAVLACDGKKFTDHISLADTYRVIRGDWFMTVSNCKYPKKDDYNMGSGGALTLLYHRTAGALLAASSLFYRVSEPNNMQFPRWQNETDCTSVRLISGDATSARAKSAECSFTDGDTATLKVTGCLTNASDEEKAKYSLTYEINENGVTVRAYCEADAKLCFYPISEEKELVCDGDTAITTNNGNVNVTYSATEKISRREKKLFQPIGGFLSFPCEIYVPAGKTAELNVKASY